MYYWSSFVKVQFATVFFLFRLMLRSGMQVAWGGELCHWEFIGCFRVICSYQVVWSSDSNACHYDLFWKQSVQFAFCNRTRKNIYVPLCIYEIGSESTDNIYCSSHGRVEVVLYVSVIWKHVLCWMCLLQVCPLNGVGSALVEFFSWLGIFLVSNQDVSTGTTWQIARLQCFRILCTHWRLPDFYFFRVMKS
jgi:hypothetical protein